METTHFSPLSPGVLAEIFNSIPLVNLSLLLERAGRGPNERTPLIRAREETGRTCSLGSYQINTVQTQTVADIVSRRSLAELRPRL